MECLRSHSCQSASVTETGDEKWRLKARELIVVLFVQLLYQPGILSPFLTSCATWVTWQSSLVCPKKWIDGWTIYGWITFTIWHNAVLILTLRNKQSNKPLLNISCFVPHGAPRKNFYSKQTLGRKETDLQNSPGSYSSLSSLNISGKLSIMGHIRNNKM